MSLSPTPPSEDEDQTDTQPADAPDGDQIDAEIRDVRQSTVAVGKNIIQIGSLQIPIYLAVLGAVAALAIIIGVVQGLGQLGAIQAVVTAPTPTPTVTSTPSPTPTETPLPPLEKMTGGFNLFVGVFGERTADGAIVQSNVGWDISLWLAKQIEGSFGQVPSLQLQVWHDGWQSTNRPLGPLDDAQAQTLIDELNANMIVYGVLDNTQDPAQLELRFVHKARPLQSEPDARIGFHRVGQSIAIEHVRDGLYRDKLDQDPRLAVRIQLLIWLARGLVQDWLGNHEAALTLLTEAERQLSTYPAWPSEAGRNVLYHFQGRQALALRRLALAEQKFTAALAGNDDYANAYLGLGNVHFERAQLALLPAGQVPAEIAACAPTDVIATARISESLPLTSTAIIGEIDAALVNYEQAHTQAIAQAWPLLEQVTGVALAYGRRLKADALIANQTEQPQWSASATSELEQAANAFTDLLPIFTAEGENGYLAYSHYGLGLTQRAQGYLAEISLQPAEALPIYAAAAENFAQCEALADQPDADGDTRLQKRTGCYCTIYKAKIEEHLSTIGGGEG